MSDRTGITREARTLSGCDVGRAILTPHGDWKTISQIIHDDEEQYVLIGTLDERGYMGTFNPWSTDTVTIRGRDE